MRPSAFRLIALLTLLAFLAACSVPRSRGRGSDDDDSSLDDDDSATDDDDDDDDDDNADDDDDDDDDLADDDDDDSAVDDDDAFPDDLLGTWTGTPTGTLDVGGTIYACAEDLSIATLEVTIGGLATGSLGCFLESLALLCSATPTNVNVNEGPTPVLVDCVNDFFTLEWNTDGATYLGGWVYGTVDIGQIIVVDIAFTLQRDL
jgi:hypothetical protein